MPRTVYWQRVLDAVQRRVAAPDDRTDVLLPTEDVACETNWPAYGDPAAAQLRSSSHDYARGGNVDRYLVRIARAARHDPTTRVLVINMHPFVRLPLLLGKIDNVYVADGSLTVEERALNPRTISLPALPVITRGSGTCPERPMLAVFQGVETHPVRHALAAIGNGATIVVNLVDRDHHCGRINALTGSTDAGYQQLLARSVFAFVPRGDAHFSYRLLEAMAFGCIPVILSDGWVLPFDRTLRWNAFSLRFRAEEIPGIPGALLAIGEQTVASLRREGQRVYDAHFRDLDRIIHTLLAELGTLGTSTTRQAPS